ncbi:glycosyl transferase group 1 [Dichotomocladium elegans]|nr:glycosyl transferase group 1 [Dichotomocladium elegans]
MRIAIITENFLPKVDGVTRTLSRLLEHLEQTGHEVLLLGPESGMKEFASAELMGTAGIPFPPYPELKLNLWRPAFTRRLLEFDPHVIHLVDPVWLGAVGLAICRYYLPKTPLVSSYHTNLATYCGHFGFGAFVPSMWRWNKFCHSFCKYVACPSKSTKRILAEQGFSSNIRIWPRGVDMRLFSPARRTPDTLWPDHVGKTILLYVGRVSYEKNLGLVIEAYRKMDHDRCHLVIVGHGPAMDEIRSGCIQSSLCVTFTGYLQGTELATVYASADVFVFPSTTETFGQVVLEAMASGLPVCGLWAEGVCDLVDHGRTGLLLDATDLSKEELTAGYRKQMETLVNKTQLRIEMGRAAVRSAKQYTWWEAMECMTQIYRDAIADSASNSMTTATSADVAVPENLCHEDSGVEEDFCLGDEDSDVLFLISPSIPSAIID